MIQNFWLGFALLGLFGWRCDVGAQETIIPLDRARLRFELAQELARADGGKLWGISLAGPMLFVDPRTRAVVANQADGAGQLTAQEGVWVGQLPSEIQPANTSLEWSGVRWTMVVWTALPGSVYESGRLLMHESFHRVQPELRLVPASPANAHLDSEQGRAWMRLEMRAWAEALIREGEQRRRAAQDALWFRAVRAELTGATAAAEEQDLEANEGISEYTGLRLSGLSPWAQVQRVAVDLERRESQPTFSRSFAYATGPAIGFLLDEVDPQWRETVADNDRLASRLAAALNVHPPAGSELLTRAREIAIARYEGQWVLADEQARTRQRAARLAELQTQFAEGHCLRIETGPQFRFSFDPNAAESLDEHRIFYRPLNASDEWGEVSAPEGALIDFHAPMCLRLAIPEGATVEALPWKLNLKPGYRLDASTSGNWKIVNDNR